MKLSDRIDRLVRAEPGIHSRSELSRQFNVSRERVRQIVNKHGLRQFIRERVSDLMNRLVRAEPGVYSREELSRRFDISHEQIGRIIKTRELHQLVCGRVPDQMSKLVQARPGTFSRAELSERFGVSRGQIQQIIHQGELHQLVRGHHREHQAVQEIEIIPEQQPETVEINPTPAHTTRAMICPRCNAPLVLEHDHYGWYEDCIFCGYNNDLYIGDVQGECLTMVSSGGLVI